MQISKGYAHRFQQGDVARIHGALGPDQVVQIHLGDGDILAHQGVLAPDQHIFKAVDPLAKVGMVKALVELALLVDDPGFQ